MILIRCGIFFYGIGKDAVILSEKFGLNPICITDGICKCAIPVIKIDKFLKVLVARKVFVVIYEYYSKNDKRNKQYELLKNAIYILKIDERRRLYYIDKMDAELNFQRVLLRIMLHNRWIDEKKFEVVMDMIYEIGKLIGGLIKYYAKKI